MSLWLFRFGSSGQYPLVHSFFCDKLLIFQDKKKASLDNLGVKNAIRINNLLYLFIVLLINTTITVKQNYGTIYRQLWDYSLFFWYKVKRNFVHWRALKLSVIISIHVFPFRFQAVGFLTQRGALLSLDIPTKFQLGKIEILFIFT